MNVANANGGRRLEEPHDFVRREVASALSGGLKVIPGTEYHVANLDQKHPEHLNRMGRWVKDHGQAIESLLAKGT